MVIAEGHAEYEATFGGYDDVTPQDVIDDYINYLSQSECLYIVKPTGNIRLQAWVIMQEVMVEEVIYGDEIEGQTFYIINQGGRIETTNNGIELMSYALNFMHPEKEYLLFCNTCELSDFTDELYYMHASSYFYFALDDNECVAAVYEKDKLYRDYPLCEFFVQTEAIIPAITEFKNQVIVHFLNSSQN